MVREFVRSISQLGNCRLSFMKHFDCSRGWADQGPIRTGAPNRMRPCLFRLPALHR